MTRNAASGTRRNRRENGSVPAPVRQRRGGSLQSCRRTAGWNRHLCACLRGIGRRSATYRRWRLATRLHDVDLTVGGPRSMDRVVRKHPERRPQSLSDGQLHTKLETPVSLHEEWRSIVAPQNSSCHIVRHALLTDARDCAAAIAGVTSDIDAPSASDTRMASHCSRLCDPLRGPTADWRD